MGTQEHNSTTVNVAPKLGTGGPLKAILPQRPEILMPGTNVGTNVELPFVMG